MAKMFLGKYFPPSMVTKLINEITNFRQHPDESLFEEWECYKVSIDRCSNHNMFPVTQIDTFYNGLTLRHRDTINAAAGGTFMKRRLEECYDLIENMTAYHNDWDTSAQWSESSSSITSYPNTEIAALKAEMAKINKKSYENSSATVGNTQNVYAAGAYQGNSYQPQVHEDEYRSSSGSRTLPGNTITNPKEDLKGITTRSETAYQGPMILTTSSSSLPPVVERETEATKDTVHPTNNESTKDVQPLVVPTESPILNSEPVIAPIIKPVASPVGTPRPSQRPSIPYPSRLQDQKLRDKANDQRDKFFQIFKDLNFNINFADALILMPKFGPTIKTLLTNKDKLSELARTSLNEHCSAVLLNKLPKKLGDPGNINLMPLSVWNKLSLPKLSPTCMTLELADRLISRPVGVAEDVFVKVGELTLRVGKYAITFNLDQTSRHSANYNDMTANRIDVIDMACEEYSQEVLGFSDVIASGNPTPYYDPIFSTTSLTLTPFENSDFHLEEVDAFLALEDDPTSPKVDQSCVDTEGGILLLEAFLNDDPSIPPPNQGNYLPQVRKELKICEAKTDKSSIDEPPEVELKDLPPYLEYAFLEGDDKLPVIIAKYLSVEEKTTLITVLKSHKRAIAWKLSDIKGIDLEFCTHKILMEEDFEPPVQHQRRVDPKIHDVIKNEEATRKDHFPLPFMEQMLERLARNRFYCFLDGFSGYFQIPIDLKDQEKTTFTCPYRMFAYCRMPFGFCNAPGTFQMCMMAIFHDMIEKTTEVFMDDFSVFENSFQTYLSHLEKMLKRCEDTNLCLNWEKSHFMVKEGIVLSHKISKNGIDVDKAKVDVIADLPHLTTVKGIRSFLGHAGFYRRKPLTFSWLATMDPSGDIMAQITQPRRSLGESILAIGEDFASSDAILSLKSCCKMVSLANLASQVGWGSKQEGFLGKLLSGDGGVHVCNLGGKNGYRVQCFKRRGDR
nr:reverse transcriptase domain-containing protein [Tanacetum cinerariifolium]